MKNSTKTSLLMIPMVAMVISALTTSSRNALAEMQPSRSKRVWSNDDFLSTETPFAVSEAKPNSAPKETTKESAKEVMKEVPKPDPELLKAQEEVRDGILASAKIRRKAYDNTVNEVKAKLEKETNAFRIEVYNNILRDTEALKEINKQEFKQFGGKADNEEKMGIKVDSDKQ